MTKNSIMKKIHKLLFALVIVMVAVPAFGRNLINVDLNKIEVDMMMNPAEYGTLFDRFVKCDTTLTDDQVATVYFGQAFSYNYDPGATFPVIIDAYERGDFATVASLVDAVVDQQPLSLDLIVMGIIGATRLEGDNYSELLEKLQTRLDMIAGVIINSGSGTSSDSPFYVASSEDLKQFMVNILGVSEVVDTSLVGDGDIEAFIVRFPGSEREHILYFNNSLQHRYDAAHQ